MNNNENPKMWIWGRHAVFTLLKNKKTVYKLLMTQNVHKRYQDMIPNNIQKMDIVSVKKISSFLPNNSIHQGIAAYVDFPKSISLEKMIHSTKKYTDIKNSIFIVCDNVQDTQNLGCIFRLSAAFNVHGIIVEKRRCAPITGATIKASAGSFDCIPYTIVNNIKDSIMTFYEYGYSIYCLNTQNNDSDNIEKKKFSKKSVFIIGSESKGIRKSILSHNVCQHVHIPMFYHMQSLNVASALSICLYHYSIQDSIF